MSLNQRNSKKLEGIVPFVKGEWGRLVYGSPNIYIYITKKMSNASLHYMNSKLNLVFIIERKP